ncbi:hypothetical protein D9O36_20700 [Zobellia amurskyensis]|uniref:DoxX-like protein n=1 Tax=Zobellia amurskyensis TaxID=248905 RepID=A0A7X2ZXM9_9FLAO|nr:hypothetical protein [Zobellia amurskyensis]MUH38276.1 hypothetical protein [Zobellia amurskyensis]
MGQDIKPPASFWLVSTFAILWNIIEIYFSSYELDFLQEHLTTEEFNKMQSLPIWYIVIFIVALFAEMLGSFMLFMRKKIASNFFAIALITLLFIELYWLLVFDIKKTSVVFYAIIPVVVIAIATFLYFYSKRATKKGWLQ